MKISKEERIKELYYELADPNLDGPIARLHMAEYLHLTQKSDDGYWLFLTKDQVKSIAEILIAHERLRSVKLFASVGLALIAGAYVFSKSSLFKKPNPVQDRLDYLLDENRVSTYTTEEFKVVMAEASALLANTAMGLLSEEELLKVQAEICDPSPETEDIQKG